MIEENRTHQSRDTNTVRTSVPFLCHLSPFNSFLQHTHTNTRTPRLSLAAVAPTPCLEVVGTSLSSQLLHPEPSPSSSCQRESSNTEAKEKKKRKKKKEGRRREEVREKVIPNFNILLFCRLNFRRRQLYNLYVLYHVCFLVGVS